MHRLLLPLVFSLVCCAQEDVAAVLGRVTPRLPRPGVTPGVQHISDVNAITRAWGRPGIFRGGNSPLLTQTLAYLGGLQPFTRNNLLLGLAVAGAYRQLGVVQEPFGRGLALGNFNSSALILNQLASQNPADPTVRGDLLFVAGRVQALGGQMPILVNVPVGGRQSGPSGLDAVIAEATPLVVPPPPDLVALPAEAKGSADLLDRFRSVASTVRQTHVSLQPLRLSIARMGQTLNVDTERSAVRMQVMLETAREQIAAGSEAAAQESLGIAEGESRRVRRTLGQ
jgi:hypothetical protein